MPSKTIKSKVAVSFFSSLFSGVVVLGDAEHSRQDVVAPEDERGHRQVPGDRAAAEAEEGSR